MDILEKIVAYKKQEVIKQKQLISANTLEKFKHFKRFPLSFADHIKHGSGIIAEHKRKSPSKGIINDSLNHINIIKGYENAGASAISILTDEHFFGGSLMHLESARDHINIPLLRKDFIIDEYQIIQAKANGADAILLIAAILTKEEITKLASIAQSNGLETLLEIHNEDELEKLNDFIDVVGINNRNLKTFDVDLNHSIKLLSQLPNHIVRIAESGIHSAETAHKLYKSGFEGFLIGEHFMKASIPSEKCRKFVNELNSLKNG